MLVVGTSKYCFMAQQVSTCHFSTVYPVGECSCRIQQHWQRETERKVLVQSRMKSRVWSFYFRFLVNHYTALGVGPPLGELLVSQSLADDCLENKASIKLPFVSKSVVLVGE